MKVNLPFWSLSVPDEGYFTLLEFTPVFCGVRGLSNLLSLSVPDEGYVTLPEFTPVLSGVR